eukprot:CAMPEP_0178427598 /NCGR_PEP_ID=MMETSP0689_2-20121128/29829_1 /TAXON_ID=160604 /ORGANISM="Amphidinium massartii, Strain CS-259" /LENGTH=201 /DNA_ID=CAMNT_0020049313 /DNA_START=325 /DNA_END=927 /DNA_ORIENTATION=+
MGASSIIGAYIAVDLASMGFLDVFKGWREVDKGMVAHHVLVFVTYLEIIIYNDPRAYIAASAMLMELSTPFVSAIWFLRHFDMKETVWYGLNAVAILLLFFLCRILFLPVLAWVWYIDTACRSEGLWWVWIFTSMYFLNMYWFAKLITGAIKAVNGSVETLPGTTKKGTDASIAGDQRVLENEGTETSEDQQDPAEEEIDV